jgi:hypothetical protein
VKLKKSKKLDRSEKSLEKKRRTKRESSEKVRNHHRAHKSAESPPERGVDSHARRVDLHALSMRKEENAEKARERSATQSEDR